MQYHLNNRKLFLGKWGSNVCGQHGFGCMINASRWYISNLCLQNGGPAEPWFWYRRMPEGHGLGDLLGAWHCTRHWEHSGSTFRGDRSWSNSQISQIVAVINANRDVSRAPWKESYDKPRQSVKKQRHHFANKGPPSQSYGFSSSHVQIWELNHKEYWAPKNWCFWIMVLEKTLESPLDWKINPVNLKGNQS